MSSNAYFEFVSQDYINKYITTSAVVFLVYDIILNLVSEYHFIWRTQWGAVKSLYYFARYGALINLSISFIVHLIPAPSHKM
ncbi:hypothetical protein QCA50_004965 [Cerrena zonata]|uniref:DUF6533 domain-containing protein n=1 Tax=Cerrena zonata TaxID=2478898 RepID=A0AAW0GDU8_9APHY